MTNKKLSLKEAAAVITGLYDDREVLDLYEAGDKLSHGQTKHDIGHAFGGRDFGVPFFLRACSASRSR